MERAFSFPVMFSTMCIGGIILRIGMEMKSVLVGIIGTVVLGMSIIMILRGEGK